MTTPKRIAVAVLVVAAVGALAMVGAFSFSPPSQPSASVDWSPPIPATTTTTAPIPPSTINDVAEASRTATTTTTAPPPSTAAGSETAPPPPAAPAPPTTTTVPASSPKPGSSNSAFENDFASRINGLRSQNGLAALSRSGDLDSSARSWAKTMAERGKLAHSNLGRLIPPWGVAAENVGMGNSTSQVFGLLADSSGHRANMLGTSFTHMGIGVYVDGAGILWTAHLFAG